MGGNQSQPNATAIIGTGKGGPLDTSAGTIASRGISFTYDHAAEPALRDITLTVPAGECIVLCGASGCGKTSYTRVANGLIPSFFHGAFAGNQTTCGLDVETVPIDRLTPLAGSVFQNPKTQYFNANVTDELAFPAENIGLPAEDINRRITAVAERFGIGHLLHRSIFHLSGGQKQRIAVAAATMLGPRLVVLDEPTSNLDANAIADMRAMIEQMKDEGLTIVIAEHRLAWLNGVADRYVVFDGGHIVQDYEADEFLSLSPGCVAAMGLRALDLQPYRRRIAALASSPAADDGTSVLLGTHNLTIGYKGKDGFTRAIPDLRFRAGEITGLMGNNGCGNWRAKARRFSWSPTMRSSPPAGATALSILAPTIPGTTARMPVTQMPAAPTLMPLPISPPHPPMKGTRNDRQQHHGFHGLRHHRLAR